MDRNNEEYDLNFKEIIQDLTEREKEVMTLYYCGNFKMEEISQVINRHHTRVYQIHKGAIKKLRKKYK